ncbi:MAG: heme exporter protein CcmB [Flavobacteriales bacterium]|jgi:heme exporter protein B|nr:heme exporter protein CcmB [Flavobacteriales bacterium]
MKALIVKEFKLEWRNRYALYGMLLYVVSTVFVCYLSFKQVVSVPVWNALFWIIMLFASINAVGRSFIQERRGRLLYYYSTCSPQAFVLAKMVYNAFVMLVITILAYLIYTWFIGDLVQDHFMFVVALVLGSTGFALILTLMSAIASKTENNISLMAILSFPVQLPFLITLIKLSKNASDGLDPTISYGLVLVLVMIIVMVVTLSYVLFPYLWRD